MSQASGIQIVNSMRLERGPTIPIVHRSSRRFCGDPFAGDALAGRGVCSFHGHGRGRYVPAPVEGYTLLASLRGTLQVESVDGVFALGARQFICLPNPSLGIVRAAYPCQWMGLRLPDPFLRQLALTRAFCNLPAPLLLPACTPLTSEMLTRTGEILRHVPGSDPGETGERFASLLLSALHAQSPLKDWTRRAYGRSERHRRSVVVRLLSARNRILNAPFMNHDLEALAAAAMYSSSHFLRSFRDVFGKTPHGLLTETRINLARELIRDSDLAIGEVAANVGYESRHAFSRLFKRETGVTATDYRLAVCAGRSPRL